MRVFAHLFRLVWGGDVDRALRPLLAVSLVGSIAGGAWWVFIGIWAVKSVGVSGGLLGAGYLVGALLSAIAGYAGGHLSDHLGRRPLILVAYAFEAVFPLTLIAVGHRDLLAAALLAVGGTFGAFGSAADQAMVADVVPAERTEAAYASMRVASNLGVTIGPPLGGLFILLGSWHALFVGVAGLGALTWLLAYRYLPRRGRYAPAEPPTRGSLRVIVRDRPFLVFLVSGALAQFVYIAYEVVMPISLVGSHGYGAATWGFLVVVNPLLVTLCQLRLTRAAARFSPAPKLAAAMLLMGLPFLALPLSTAVPVVVAVIVVFVVGEMLWVPTSQSIIVALAPEDLRGAYMGAFGGTWAVGNAATPFLGLQVRHVYGDAVMWVCVAGVGVVAGALGFAAARGHDREAAISSAA